MKGYKGFNPGLVCRGKQYAENTVYEEEKAVICKRGMHFCENPFDVLDYYDLVRNDGSFNDFAEVEALADTDTDDNKKFCTSKLRVGAKLSVSGFIKACVAFAIEKTKINNKETDISDNGGYSARIGSSGYSAQIGSSGDSAQIGSSGYSARIGSSGDSARIASEGKYAVVCCAGHGSIAKAKKGSWITLSEWEYNDKEKAYIPVCVKTRKVDGKHIKENVFYELRNGKFVEVE